MPRITHRMTNTPTYESWRAMRRRCTNPVRYPRYAGRGIKVCERWAGSFEAFLADMGERPDGMTLDRIDGDGDYGPGNCRWATQSEQCRNMSTTRMVELNGERVSLVTAAERSGVKPGTARARLNDGWIVERALKPGKVPQRRALAPEQEAEIKRIHVWGCSQQGAKALARRYGVHLATIQRVLAR